uniref:Inhibitor of growth protein n=1 Tax=Sinocyclocheilus rhinocerous TaxID=307959 RepID=A0A673J0N5_9TELE
KRCSWWTKLSIHIKSSVIVRILNYIHNKYFSVISELLKELDEAYEKHCHEEDPIRRRCLLHCIQRALIQSQELGDEKIQLASQMVENRRRQVDSLAELLETQHEPQESMTKRGGETKRGSIERLSGANKSARRQKNSNIDTQENISTVHHDEETSSIVREKRNKTSKKKKRSKAKADTEQSHTDIPIDPNEPTYCLCEQVSFGQMIGCDNDECPIEWFHFSCVGLNHKPKGKWYCPKCRGDTEKTMDKALEKAKKERAYNILADLKQLIIWIYTLFSVLSGGSFNLRT